MDTKWKPVVGYESLYLISEDGRVRSLRTGKIMKPSTSALGYKRVILYAPGREPKTKALHSLVLEAFVGPRPDKGLCRHLNGHPGDNRKENLTWGTPSENMYDRVAHGRNHNQVKHACPRGHLLQPPNIRNEKAISGWRACKACHQARSDQYNGSVLSLEQSADLRYQMILKGLTFSHGTRKGQEAELYKKLVTDV